jgi:CheY-like chemotaxis protein
MSRILLADDSAHAQRIGECILREEGFEVVSVTDGDTALVRLADVDPDVVLASVRLPRRNGYEICRHVKENPRQRHTRVVLTAGALDPLDEEEAGRVQADASLRKPFEATVLLQTLKPLVEAAQREREQLTKRADTAPAQPDPELVRAAVTLALDAAFPTLVEEITARVRASLNRSGAS